MNTAPHPQPRCDARLIRHLAEEYGLPCARAWQRLPVIDLEARARNVEQRMNAIADAHPTLDYHPFEEFVLCMGMATMAPKFAVPLDSAERPGQCHLLEADQQARPTVVDVYGRFSFLEHYERALHTRPWFQRHGDRRYLEQRAGRVGERHVVVELFLRFPRAVARLGAREVREPWSAPLVYAAPLSRWQHGQEYAICETRGLYADEVARVAGSVRTLAGSALCTMLELAHVPAYLVEERPVQPSGKLARHERPDSPKPWARRYLPRVILLDPAQAPRPTGPAQGGTHASPVAHPRRGHSRTYRSERFRPELRGRSVYIKPMWIGPKTWRADGREYRVVDRAAESDAARVAAIRGKSA